MYTKQQSRLGVVITLALALAFIFSPVAWTNVVPATHAASREPVRAEHGIVASTNEVASRVGVDIMKRGGNAIDAAIAVAFALAVTHPAAGNLGGGGFMMIRLKDGKTTAIDYREMAPAAATHNIYLDQNGNLIAGEGGSLVVHFQTPLWNHPRNPFGLDFTVFGNCGLIITNDFDPLTYNWIGTPATDGSLFGENTGVTRVSVSRDGFVYYTLNPNSARTVDNLFPTDGAGDFRIPISPVITQADMAGLTLNEIRALYHGSAGGTSFAISSAQDEQGRRVFLPEIQFIRIEVLSGKAEVDGFAAVAPVSKSRGHRHERDRDRDWFEGRIASREAERY